MEVVGYILKRPKLLPSNSSNQIAVLHYSLRGSVSLFFNIRRTAHTSGKGNNNGFQECQSTLDLVTWTTLNSRCFKFCFQSSELPNNNKIWPVIQMQLKIHLVTSIYTDKTLICNKFPLKSNTNVWRKVPKIYKQYTR